MNNILFSKSFVFRIISHQRNAHSDNTHANGLDKNYVARMITGSGRIVMIDGEEIILNKGDVFYLPMGVRYHSYWTPCKECGRVEWESYGFVYFPDREEKQFGAQKIEADETVRALLDTLKADMTVSPTSVGALYSFLGYVAPAMLRTDLDRNAIIYRKATEFIDSHTNFKVSELAKVCGMSESALYSFFKAYAGQTPTEVKNKFRIKKAVGLLGSTDLSVEEISDSLGFCTVAYFRRVFRAVTGKTPTEIRKEMSKKYNL